MGKILPNDGKEKKILPKERLVTQKLQSTMY